MIIREIEENDYHKNYMEVINYFTRTPQKISFEEFKNQLNKCLSQNTKIFVVEYNNIIIGTLKLLIEYKLHNNFKNIGHVEDFIIDEKYRKQGLGKKLMDYLIDISKKNNCYKVVLNCNDDVIKFYKKNNFKIKGTEMCLYL